jgi:hypothetical protein
LAGVENANAYGIGKSIVPIMKNPSASVQDHTIFAYDDLFFLPANVPGGHIRGLRTNEWTYHVYYGLDGSGLEYELYDNTNDPGQLKNLLHGEPAADLRKEWSSSHQVLTKRFVAAGNLPDSFGWPLDPSTSTV